MENLTAGNRFAGWLILCLLTGCHATHLAPVREATTLQLVKHRYHYRVRSKDTLYSIAWRYGYDYRDLALTNHLTAPYSLRQGQILIIDRPRDLAKKIQKTGIKIANLVSKESNKQRNAWIWPAAGKLTQVFDPTKGHKGIDIAGKLGTPVRACSQGMVAYRGKGLRGYGNLLIIKHDDNLLSAYAHNQRLLVQEGARVNAGQIIARLGETDAAYPHLHFEIRYAGKPVNPLYYLKR